MPWWLMDQQIKPISRGKGAGRREMGHQKAPGKEGKEPVGVCWEGGAKARETENRPRDFQLQFVFFLS